MIRAFLTTDPLVAALLLTGGSVCLFLLLRAWYRAWVRHKEAKQAREVDKRHRYDAFMKAQSESRERIHRRVS